MVKRDDALDLIILILGAGQFGLQQIFLSNQHLQIIHLSVLHQQAGIPHRRPQQGDLLLVHINTLTGCLPSHQGIVHFYSRIQQALSEKQQSLFLLCLGYLQVGLILSFLEQRATPPSIEKSNEGRNA